MGALFYARGCTWDGRKSFVLGVVNFREQRRGVLAGHFSLERAPAPASAGLVILLVGLTFGSMSLERFA